MPSAYRCFCFVSNCTTRVGIDAYLLSIDGGARHVGNHCVASTPRVLGVAQGVVFGSGLREPDVTTVSPQVARLEGISNVLLDDDGTASGVDEP